MPLYFAYGSNMDRDAMAARCPSSRPLGTGRLAGHRFAIMAEGYATVEPDRLRAVWGLVWDLSLRDVPALDRYEAVADGLYRKAILPVLTEDGPRRTLVYLGRSRGKGRPLPGYMEAVLAAARREGLPDAYLRELSRFLPPAAAVVRSLSLGQPAAPAVRPLWSAPGGERLPSRSR